MPRNARSPNDLQDDAQRGPSAGEVEDAGAPPPLAITPLGADPALGWAGWGAEPLAPWTAAPAELEVRDGEDEHDRPRREPREM